VFALYANNDDENSSDGSGGGGGDVLTPEAFTRLIADLVAARDELAPADPTDMPMQCAYGGEVDASVNILAASVGRLVALPRNKATNEIRAAHFKRLVVDDWDTVVLSHPTVIDAGGEGLPCPVAAADRLEAYVNARRDRARAVSALDAGVNRALPALVVGAPPRGNGAVDGDRGGSDDGIVEMARAVLGDRTASQADKAQAAKVLASVLSTRRQVNATGDAI